MPNEITHNEKTKRLSGIFYKALKQHIPGLKPEHVEVKELVFALNEVSDEHLASMRAAMKQDNFNEEENVNLFEETHIHFPVELVKDDKKAQKISDVLKTASQMMTMHWTSAQTNGIKIHASLETVDSHINDELIALVKNGLTQ